MTAGGAPRMQVDLFLAHLVERAFAANTVAAYANDLAQLVAFLDRGERGWSWPTVARAQLGAFVAGLGERGYAPASRARKLACAKTFFHWLASEGAIAADPTAHLAPVPVEDVLQRVLSADELAALVAAPDRKSGPEAARDGAMLHLLGATGVRASELVGLDVGDVNLRADLLHVRRGARLLPFDAATHAALAIYLEGGRPRLVDRVDVDALFLNHRGERMTRQGFWLRLREYALAAGCPGISPATLRHSFAVHLLGGGARLVDVQELLGHAAVQTTYRYDRHPVARSERRAAGGHA